MLKELSEKQQLIADHEHDAIATKCYSNWGSWVIHYTDGEKVLVSLQTSIDTLYGHDNPFYWVKIEENGSFRIRGQRHNLSEYLRTNI